MRIQGLGRPHAEPGFPLRLVDTPEAFFQSEFDEIFKRRLHT